MAIIKFVHVIKNIVRAPLARGGEQRSLALAVGPAGQTIKRGYALKSKDDEAAKVDGNEIKHKKKEADGACSGIQTVSQQAS
jgi:hypothetical protein